MSAERRREALARLRQLTSKEAIIDIIGGEPTLYPDLLLDAVDDASKAGFTVFMVTNGSGLTPDLIQSLGKVGLKRLAISVDCDQGLTRGDLNRALALLNIAKQLGIVPVINTVITSRTDLITFRTFARRIIGDGFFLSPLTCSPMIPGGAFSNAPAHLVPQNAQLRHIVPFLARQKLTTGQVTASFSYLWTRYLHNHSHRSAVQLWHCSPHFRRNLWTPGRNYLTMDSDGAIGPCQEFPRVTSILELSSTNLSLQHLDALCTQTTRRCPGCLHNCYIMSEQVHGIKALAEVPTALRVAAVSGDHFSTRLAGTV